MNKKISSTVKKRNTIELFLQLSIKNMKKYVKISDQKLSKLLKTECRLKIIKP